MIFRNEPGREPEENTFGKVDFFVYEIAAIDIDKMSYRVMEYCSAKGFGGNLVLHQMDPEDIPGYENGKLTSILYLIKGSSSQGIEIQYIDGIDPQIKVTVPSYASWGDVAIAFGILTAITEDNPECVVGISENNNELRSFIVCDENRKVLYATRLNNIYNCIAGVPYNAFAILNGCNHKSVFAPIYEKFDSDDKQFWDFSQKAMQQFVKTQWAYEDYKTIPLEEITSPWGEPRTARAVNNEADTFVEVCQYLVFINPSNGESKNVPLDEFIRNFGDNPYLEHVDTLQFIIHKMPDEEWMTMFDSLTAVL